MHDLPLITTIAAAFTAAWVLGLITQSLKLSPIGTACSASRATTSWSLAP